MTDLSITAANVLKVSGVTKSGDAGADLTGGQMVYKDATDSKLKLADSDGAAALRECIGMVLSGGAGNGQPAHLIEEGVVSLGAILTPGKIYVLSDTPGGIMPADDLETGDYVTIVGVAVSTTQLKIKIWNTGAQV